MWASKILTLTEFCLNFERLRARSLTASFDPCSHSETGTEFVFQGLIPIEVVLARNGRTQNCTRFNILATSHLLNILISGFSPATKPSKCTSVYITARLSCANLFYNENWSINLLKKGLIISRLKEWTLHFLLAENIMKDYNSIIMNEAFSYLGTFFLFYEIQKKGSYFF